MDFTKLFFFLITKFLLLFPLCAQITSSGITTYSVLPSLESYDENKIYLIILSDGYSSTEEEKFMGNQTGTIAGDAEEFLIDLNYYRTPYKEYMSYFEVYKIFEPCGTSEPCSTLSGIHHPLDLSSSPPECEQGVQELLFPRFKSTLDKYGIHRGLGAYIPSSGTETSGYDEIIDFLSPHFGSSIDPADGFEKLPANVFVVVICNDDNYAGAANIPRRICYVTGGYTRNQIYEGVANNYVNDYLNFNFDGASASHELSHIFAGLQDEYWFNCDNIQPIEFDCGDAHIAPNRFNPSTQNITDLWEHWLDISGIGLNNIYGIQLTNCSSGQWSLPQGTTEYKAPRSHGMCFMGTLYTQRHCAVCREAIIMKIYDLISPINSVNPSNGTEDVYEASSSLSFSLDLTTPNPNTIRVKWELVDANDNVTELETDFNGAGQENGINGSAGGSPSGVYQWNMECEVFNELSEGDYTIRARIYDMTGESEDDEDRWVRHPNYEIDNTDPEDENYEEVVEWTVHYSGIAGTDLYAEDNANDGGLELDEGSDLDLWLSPDLWLCNDDNPSCLAPGDGPSYTGAGSQAQVNLLVKNKGCKMFDATEDNGTVTFWWAKAKTLLEWPEDWNGDEIAPSGPLKGDEIGSPIMMLEDIDITNTNGVVVVSTLWDIPDPDSYLGLGLGLYDDNDITHFCFLALINSNNDPAEMIEVGDYRLYGSVLQSNNIVWRNVEIIDESSFTGGGSGQTTSSDVIRGGGVIVSNNDSLSRNYKLRFEVPSSESGKPITEEAEVRVILSDSLWSKWIQGGEQGNDIAIFDSTLHQILLEDTLSFISGLSLDSNTNLGMFVSFNFLTQERTSKELFTLHVTQILDDSTQRVLGGETYVIKPDPNRAYFTADAGDDKEVIIGNAYSQTAKAITDSAIYNWYNSSGVRLQTGITFSDSATTTSTETYKLEVIAKSDGYKDYDEVTISTKLGKLTSIVPNPISTGTLAIGYLVASSVSTPKIRIVNISTSAYTEHSISTGSGTLNVDISPYTTGSYSIILICDSTTADDELLVVQ